MLIQMIDGSPAAGGRTTRLGSALCDGIAALLGTGRIAAPVDLSRHAATLLLSGGGETAGLVRQVMEADILVVASPTWKAGIPGLLKAFLDHFGAGDLHGKVAVPAMTGGSLQHALAVEHVLRPVLSELGASMPCPGLFAVASTLDRAEDVARGYLEPQRYVLLGAAHGIGLARRGRAGGQA